MLSAELPMPGNIVFWPFEESVPDNLLLASGAHFHNCISFYGASLPVNSASSILHRLSELLCRHFHIPYKKAHICNYHCKEMIRSHNEVPVRDCLFPRCRLPMQKVSPKECGSCDTVSKMVLISQKSSLLCHTGASSYRLFHICKAIDNFLPLHLL